MADILASIGLIVTSAVTWVGSYLTVIVSNPILLMFVVISFVGLGIGIISRLFRVN